MEMEIKVVVGVSDEQHAKLIMEDIKKVIMNRTVIWFVGEPECPKIFVDALYAKKWAKKE